MTLDEIIERKEPLHYLVSSEESRVEAELQRYCATRQPPRPLFRWSCTRGMEKMQGGVVEPIRLPEEADARTQQQAPLVAVLRYAVHDCKEDGIFLLKDVHQFLKGGATNINPTMSLTTRALRDAFYELRALAKPRKIVLLAPELIVPTDLEKEIRIDDLPLPSADELAITVDKMLRRAQAIREKDSTFVYEVADPKTTARALVTAAVGLTEVETEYVFENMLYVQRRVTSEAPRHVVREKQQIIRKSGILEFIPSEDLQALEVGGLEALLRWLQLRKHVFENRERAFNEYGIRQLPRGVLLAGISGCGKSLVCKRIAYEWGCPLLRLDMGAVFDRWVGASEERMRKALKVAESVAPCILWIDEIEKGFSTGIGGDGGTSSRVLGTFLVWMQEKKVPVFVAATANDITTLPPELLRSGRFDNRFFVGCPGDRSRRAIFEIHLRGSKLNPVEFDLDHLVKISLGYTGAEIEQAVADSTYDAFFENRRANTKDVAGNMQRSRPLVQSLARQMERILEMLQTGRMESASRDTVPVEQLIQQPKNQANQS